MSLRRKLAATAATALLLSTACGGTSDGSDGSADDPVPGVDEGEETSPTPEDEATPEPEARHGSEIELPDDVELVFDWDTPEDPDEAAALHGASEYLRAIAAGVAAQDSEHPAYRGLSLDQAHDYAQDQIQQWVDGGWTKTGTDRYYDPVVEHNETVIGVSFCRDSSEIFGKEVESGEIVEVESDSEYSSYSYYTVVLVEALGVEGFWQVSAIEVAGDAAQCA